MIIHDWRQLYGNHPANRLLGHLHWDNDLAVQESIDRLRTLRRFPAHKTTHAWLRELRRELLYLHDLLEERTPLSRIRRLVEHLDQDCSAIGQRAKRLLALRALNLEALEHLISEVRALQRRAATIPASMRRQLDDIAERESQITTASYTLGFEISRAKINPTGVRQPGNRPSGPPEADVRRPGS